MKSDPEGSATHPTLTTPLTTFEEMVRGVVSVGLERGDFREDLGDLSLHRPDLLSVLSSRCWARSSISSGFRHDVVVVVVVVVVVAVTVTVTVELGTQLRDGLFLESDSLVDLEAVLNESQEQDLVVAEVVFGISVDELDTELYSAAGLETGVLDVSYDGLQNLLRP